MSDAARLSRLLFAAREVCDMYGDVVEKLSGPGGLQNHARMVRDDIDQFRAERGWSPDGFGGEE